MTPAMHGAKCDTDVTWPTLRETFQTHGEHVLPCRQSFRIRAPPATRPPLQQAAGGVPSQRTLQTLQRPCPVGAWAAAARRARADGRARQCLNSKSPLRARPPRPANPTTTRLGMLERPMLETTAPSRVGLGRMTVSASGLAAPSA
eukprot:14139367-Alexandrium_andersonii.AAC.2